MALRHRIALELVAALLSLLVTFLLVLLWGSLLCLVYPENCAPQHWILFNQSTKQPSHILCCPDAEEK